MTNPIMVVFKSKTHGKYLRYMPEHGEFKNILHVSGEDGFNPYTRFLAEPSTEYYHDCHIKSCYNNKYLVTRQVKHGFAIFCDANEPDEDLDKPSCTLFRMHFGRIGGTNPTKHAFQQYRFGEDTFFYVVPSSDPTLEGCLVPENNSPDSSDIEFVATVVEQPLILPKHVCFKGDNDKYLSGKYQDGLNYLQFSSDDIGDPAVTHTIHMNDDGTVRIKSDHFGKFWRNSVNWIWADYDDDGADSDDDTDNTGTETDSKKAEKKAKKNATTYRVVKFGHTIALQSLSNNNYLKRLNADGKWDCLNAAVSSISEFARLRLIETVLSRRVYNVKYHLEDAKVYDRRSLTMATVHAVNQGSTENTAKLTLKYGLTKQRSWDSSLSLKIGVTATIQAGVPEIMSAEIQTQYEFTGSYTWGKTEIQSEEQSVEYEIKVPPNTSVTLRALATQTCCDIPFTYYQEDVLTTGEKIVHHLDDGIYRGVNSYDFTYEVADQAGAG
ncbi:hypothetical protein ACP4OV_007499 [Aristida adscensionis]